MNGTGSSRRWLRSRSGCSGRGDSRDLHHDSQGEHSMSDEELIPDFEYKGWGVNLQSRMIPDGKGWSAHVLLMRNENGDLRTVPLDFNDRRSFPSIWDANAAGRELAKAWIGRNS